MIEHFNSAPINPKRVLILGGTGFIGVALKTYLQHINCPVLALSSKELDLTANDAADTLADILQSTDAVVFLSVIGPNRGHDTAALQRNIRMAENVGLALQKKPCAQLIYASSEAVYGTQEENINAQTIPTPDSLYGVMHLTRELILKQLLKNSVPLLIFRITQVYGPGCTHNAYGPNRFVRTAKQLQKIELFGQGEELRDFIYIDDVVQIMFKALQHKSVGQTNLATGNSISYYSLAQELQHCLGSDQVTITNKPRAQSITHRLYSVQDLLHAYPDLKLTVLREGIQQTLSAECQHA